MVTSDLESSTTVPGFSASLVKELEDEQYRWLEQWFVAKSRGRRPDLPSAVEPNYRVHQQLLLLQTRHGKTCEFVEGILIRSFPLATDYGFRSIYEHCLRKTPEEEDWKVFLRQTALKIGPFEEYVKRVGNGLENITRFDLLGDLDQLKDKLLNVNTNVTNETESRKDIIAEMVNPLKRKSSSAIEDSTPAKMRKPEAFKFTSQGEWVAVYYSDPNLGPTYHIGQVLDVVNENKAQVTYLEQCTLKKSQYRFGSLDIAPANMCSTMGST